MAGDPTYQAQYHKSCVTKYLTKAKRLEEKHKRSTSGSFPPHEKRTRSSMGSPFDWLHQCFYCHGPCNLDPGTRNPNRWVPAYLMRETEEKKDEHRREKIESIEKRIKDKCEERADEWAKDVLDRLAFLTVRAADLHAADAHYHKDCYARFFSGRSPPGDTKK